MRGMENTSLSVVAVLKSLTQVKETTGKDVRFPAMCDAHPVLEAWYQFLCSILDNVNSRINKSNPYAAGST